MSTIYCLNDFVVFVIIIYCVWQYIALAEVNIVKFVTPILLFDLRLRFELFLFDHFIYKQACLALIKIEKIVSR